MSKCSYLVGHGVIGQQCEGDSDHAGPHFSRSNDASMAARKLWETENDPEVAKKVLSTFQEPPQRFDQLRGEDPYRVHPAERARIAAEEEAERRAQAAEEEAAEPVVAVPQGNAPFYTEEAGSPDDYEPGETVEAEEEHTPWPGTLSDHVQDDTIVQPTEISPQSAHAMIVEGTTLVLEGINQLVAITQGAASNLRIARPMLQLDTLLSDEDAATIARIHEMLGRTADALTGVVAP